VDLRSEFQMQCLQFVCVFSLAGQLDDLLYILDEAGMPSASNKYIFNGDFVDRGSKGVEIMSILLALFMAFPGKCVRCLPFFSDGTDNDFLFLYTTSLY